MRAIAYINASRWCVDCPRPFCGNAMQMQIWQPGFYCEGGCGLTASVVWPPNAQDIWDELQRRPVATTRNWAPADHWLSRACHLEKTQTVVDLRAEFFMFDPVSALLADALQDFDHVQIGNGINLRQIES